MILTMIQPGEVIDNKMLYECFGVANSGGMRRSLNNFWIVLVADWTKTGVSNRWVGDVLHYTGQGRGNQKLEKQNRNIARSRVTGERIHLFEVHKAGEYTYIGEVELAGDPYEEEQADGSGKLRTVWMFPIRRKAASNDDGPLIISRPEPKPALPLGVYATIADGFDPAVGPQVHELLDRLKELGLTVVDNRDIQKQRFKAAQAEWYGQVLADMRRQVRDVINQERSRSRDANKTWSYKQEELELTVNSTEADIQEVLDLIGRGDEFIRVRDEALAEHDQPDPIGMDDLPEPCSEDGHR